MKRHAFTLIEMMLVVAVTAIVSVSMALNIRNVREKSIFRSHQREVVGIFQTARSMSLSNLLIEGYTAEYYKIEADSDYMILFVAYDDGTGSQQIILEEIYFDEEVEADSSLLIYYFAPDGEICFDDVDCSTTETAKTYTLTALDADYETAITIDVYGGFPEIDERP